MTDPTQMRCPESGAAHESHHLVPSGGQSPVMRCTYCGQTEKQLRDHGGIVKRTQDELAATMVERFGDDQTKWAFECPSCHDVATVVDFTEALKAAGIEGFGSDRLGQECVGRLTGALSKTTPHKKRGCDWAAFGLFRGPEYVITADGKEIAAFPIAQARS